ncbi:MAG TPA: DinB family protein [Actinomycetota bacterium]|jgi:hypothetical protein|nr:DinB family protein [Actinomycetota bacterium]
MTGAAIRPAFGTWPHYNRRLREAVASMTEEQLAIQPSPDRWPVWATIGHTLCQRVFLLCDFAGEPGAQTTRFTNAAFDCPGDDDLEHVLSSRDLVQAVDDTFRIVDGCLDRWTIDMLEDVISHPEWGEDRTHTRGWVIQRAFSHDVYHCAELNESLSAAGLPQIDLWT